MLEVAQDLGAEEILPSETTICEGDHDTHERVKVFQKSSCLLNLITKPSSRFFFASALIALLTNMMFSCSFLKLTGLGFSWYSSHPLLASRTTLLEQIHESEVSGSLKSQDS